MHGFADELEKMAVSKKWLRSRVSSGVRKALDTPGKGSKRVERFERRMEELGKREAPRIGERDPSGWRYGALGGGMMGLQTGGALGSLVGPGGQIVGALGGGLMGTMAGGSAGAATRKKLLELGRMHRTGKHRRKVKAALGESKKLREQLSRKDVGSGPYR